MSSSWPSCVLEMGSVHPTTATLESLPYELLEQIFRNACTDGGRTGCSLSLVSKRIRALSRSSRFHSVSLLTGTCSQLSSFLKTLERAREEAAVAGEPTSRVRHLCILLTTKQGQFVPPGPSFQRCPMDVRFDWKEYDRGDPLSREERNAISAEARAIYHAEIAKLFASIGTADMETLCAFQKIQRVWMISEEYIPEIVCPGGFHRLRELTLHPAYTPVFVSGAGSGPETGPLYPALERLHMRSDAYAVIDFAWWAANAPALRHLRVACDAPAGDSPKLLPNLLSTLYRTPYNLSLAAGAHEAASWRKLHKVQFMYRADFPTGAIFGPDAEATARAAHDVLMNVFREAFARVDPLVEFAPDYRLQDVNRDGLCEDQENGDVYNWPDSYEHEVVRRHWLSRLAGRGGAFTPDCWANGPPPDPRDTRMRRLSALLSHPRVRATMSVIQILCALYWVGRFVMRFV
ncbi:hypothetical protein ONZ51_g5301 [Trametes cubensis]|uniref:F-box domain-containing protein n=1 Tax=Trametes cubensis TaxID=1111947 RepID=A0AAD7XDT2_9APHY|nr:hypothetical protein ONZ51_g5301 [Trametes cubensis]